MLTDTCPMPWGKHKGKRMIDVPAAYLLWLHTEGKANGDVAAYIDDNMDVLLKETNQ